MSKTFNIGDFAKTLKVSESDTREQIEYIDMDRISGDARNFYELSDIDELAANIQLLGLQQPVRVRAAENGYTIVSGHRRMEALRKLVADGEERFRSVPCIVEVDDASPAMQELRLIFANAATRKLSSADLGKQAERIETLLYQLQEEGYEFPGRMRDHVAAACQVSRTKLATIDAIKNNLPQPFLGQWERGELTESAAYELSKIRNAQAYRFITEAIGEKYIISGNVAKKLAKHADALLENHTKHTCPNGTACQNTVGFFRGAAKQKFEYNVCNGSACCAKCYKRSSCPGKCHVVREREKPEAADRKREKEREEQRRKKKQEKLCRDLQTSAMRLIKAIDAAGLPDNAEISGFEYYGKIPVSLIRKVAAGNLEGNWYRDSLAAVNMVHPLEVAQTIQCSMDYLYGLTDVVKTQQNGENRCDSAAPTWQTGKPQKCGDVVAEFDIGADRPMRTLCWWDGEDYRFRQNGETIELPPLRWFPLPEEEKS